MYKVLCDNALMCDPRIEELALINPVVKLEENKAGSFSFTIPPGHPKYDDIFRRKSVLQVFQDDELLFSGMCVEVDTDFYKQKTIFCEGELSYFNDSIQRPARYQGITVRGLLEAYINKHNEQVEEEKRFQVGVVTVTDPNDSLYCYSNMETTMECLKADLVDDLGGYLRIRHENDIKYVDYLAESTNINTQIIKLGVNLLDFNSNLDSSEMATAIIPLGATLEESESTVEGLQTRLTIESVNDGKDYLFNQEAVNAYGWIFKTVEFDNVTTPSILKSKGETYLSETQFENVVIEVKAIDLHVAKSDIEKFRISDKIRVVSDVHGLDKYFILTEMEISLNSPEQNQFVLNSNSIVNRRSNNKLSSQSNNSIKEVEDKIEETNEYVSESIGEISDDIEEISESVGDLKIDLKKTDDGLLAEVSRATGAEGSLSSRITQTADSISSEVSRATSAESSLSSRITQTESSISLKVSKKDLVDDLNSELLITGNAIALTTGHFTISSANFSVDEYGNVTITGELTLKDGLSMYSGGDTFTNVITCTRQAMHLMKNTEANYDLTVDGTFNASSSLQLGDKSWGSKGGWIYKCNGGGGGKASSQTDTSGSGIASCGWVYGLYDALDARIKALEK